MRIAVSPSVSARSKLFSASAACPALICASKLEVVCATAGASAAIENHEVAIATHRKFTYVAIAVREVLSGVIDGPRPRCLRTQHSGILIHPWLDRHMAGKL